jgi:hypothetical protein
MIDPRLLSKARSELTRLNGELHQLHLEEERAKLKRSRLEADKAQVQALVDMCELAVRFTEKPQVPSSIRVGGHQFHVEDCHGAKLVVDRSAPTSLSDAERKPVQVRYRRPATKPDGIPTIAEMVLAILEAAEDGMRPRDIAKVARRKWWPDLRPAAVGAAAWKLHGEGRLEKDGHRYRLNGHAGE